MYTSVNEKQTELFFYNILNYFFIWKQHNLKEVQIIRTWYLVKMCGNDTAIKEDFTDSWAVCCYVFFVSLLCEGINVSNGVLMVRKNISIHMLKNFNINMNESLNV